MGREGGSSEWEVRVPRKVLPHEYGQGGRAGSLYQDQQVVLADGGEGGRMGESGVLVLGRGGEFADGCLG